MEQLIVNILENAILFMGSLTVYQNTKIYKYRKRLSKTNKYNHCTIVGSPQVLKREVDTDLVSNKQQISSTIENFITTLANNLSETDMQTIIKNIQELGYKSKLSPSEMIESLGFYGAYFPSNHYIVVSPLYRSYNQITKRDEKIKSTITHELLHASSSRKDLNGTSFVGFSQSNKLMIGRGLNEGYTELLNIRYFDSKMRRSYKYEVAVARLIELIIGKDLMTSLYFKADLNSLVQELSKYQPIPKIKEFLTNLDKITKLLYLKIETVYLPQKELSTLSTLYSQVNVFLYELYASKMDKYLAQNQTDKYFQERDQYLTLLDSLSDNTNFNKNINIISHRQK